MEDSNCTNISQDLSHYNYSNYNFEEYDFNNKVFSIMDVVIAIVIAIGLPLTLSAIYALFSLVRGDHAAPIYVINLLIADLVQISSFIIYIVDMRMWMSGHLAYWSSLAASIGFMVCIALERYLVITRPLWYRFTRNVKIPVIVCVLVWLLSLVYLLISVFFTNNRVWEIIHAIFFFFPLPLFIFFLVGTLRALSASRVPSDEKRRIVGVLVLVLLTYALLFLPIVIRYLAVGYFDLYNLTLSFHTLSPLADILLYVFMRRGIGDKLLALVCCCRVNENRDAPIDRAGTTIV